METVIVIVCSTAAEAANCVAERIAEGRACSVQPVTNGSSAWLVTTLARVTPAAEPAQTQWTRGEVAPC